VFYFKDVNILVPYGPKDRLILEQISLQALMFLSTTSSKPEKCLWPYHYQSFLTYFRRLLNPCDVSSIVPAESLVDKI